MFLDFTLLGYMALAFHLLVAAIFVAGGYTIFRIVTKRVKALNPEQATSGASQRGCAPSSAQPHGQSSQFMSRAA